MRNNCNSVTIFGTLRGQYIKYTLINTLKRQTRFRRLLKAGDHLAATAVVQVMRTQKKFTDLSNIEVVDLTGLMLH